MFKLLSWPAWLQPAVLAVASAVFLLVAGGTAALLGEADFHAQKIGQASAYARILAASVSGALAFRDAAEARHAVATLSAAPDVGAVGVYELNGNLFVGRAAAQARPPARLAGPIRPQFSHDSAVASDDVAQNGAKLGRVYVQVYGSSSIVRWMRYAGVALLLLMALLVLALIAAMQRTQQRANIELARRASELARTNARLRGEVAEREKAENALAHAQKMEAIGQLTGGVAHDFNNLLMVISGGLRLLETRDDEKRRVAIVDAMRQAVERGASLTKQLLAFSRRQKLSPEPALVQERLEHLRPLLERSLRADIALDFDFRGEDGVVKVDPGQFDLAILNLAVNARDAMPRGGRLTIRVERVSDEQGRQLAVHVMDTGVGMTPEVKTRAFDPFFTTKEVGKGTGLGLSQVYGFALQSAGNCRLESEEGKGTCVTLTLPLTDDAAPQRATHERGALEGEGRVLVVEDDDAVAALVSDLIADLGYQVARVANAGEALGALVDDATGFDVVFTDVIMPGGMSGIDLAREIRRRSPDTPILLTTGYAGRDELDTLGFPLLRKPYDRDTLGTALARICRRTARSRA